MRKKDREDLWEETDKTMQYEDRKGVQKVVTGGCKGILVG